MLFDALPMVKSESVETIKIDTTEPENEPSSKKAQYHRDPSDWELEPVAVTKSYRNQDFLNSSHARSLRIMCEQEETMQRLAANGVRATIQFFGSARARDRHQFDKAMAETVAKLDAAAPESDAHTDAEERIKKLKQIEWMVPYMASIQELARRVTAWSMTRHSRQAVSGVDRTKSALRMSRENLVELGSASMTGVEGGELGAADKDEPPRSPNPVTSFSKSPVLHRRYKYLPHHTDSNHPDARSSKAADLFVCTGGGPGFMEAANRGASQVPGGRSIGMGISLPFETGLNPYVTPELAFEYHYFFTRKFGMAYYMQALVAAPGGFGTMDELFELMTLKQTGKMNRNMPIVLFGKSYWQTILNWNAIAEFGTISQKEVDDLLFTDSVDEAFDFITSRLEELQRTIAK